MTEKEEFDVLWTQSWKAIRNSLLFLFVVATAIFLAGCKTKYIPVEVTHTEYRHTTDSVKQVDSIFHEKETVIMQLDSAAMAEYGIKLKNAEKAWLVRSKELEREIARLMAQKTDTVIKTDSIPVIIEKEKELSKFQQFKMDAGGAAIFIAVALLLLLIWKFKKSL